MPPKRLLVGHTCRSFYDDWKARTHNFYWHWSFHLGITIWAKYLWYVEPFNLTWQWRKPHHFLTIKKKQYMIILVTRTLKKAFQISRLDHQCVNPSLFVALGVLNCSENSKFAPQKKCVQRMFDRTPSSLQVKFATHHIQPSYHHALTFFGWALGFNKACPRLQCMASWFQWIDVGVGIGGAMWCHVVP